MKKSILTLLFSIVIAQITIAQLQNFIDEDFGAFQPTFTHNDFIYGNRYDENQTFIGSYKLNLLNGEATLIYDNGEPFILPINRMSKSNIHLDNIYIHYNPHNLFYFKVFRKKLYWLNTRLL